RGGRFRQARALSSSLFITIFCNNAYLDVLHSKPDVGGRVKPDFRAGNLPGQAALHAFGADFRFKQRFKTLWEERIANHISIHGIGATPVCKRQFTAKLSKL